MSEEIETSENEDAINAKKKALIDVSISDAVGLGKAAKTPAAQSILQAIGDFLQTRAQIGKNKADADKITRLAAARKDAAVIGIEEQELLQAAAIRLGNQELRKQINLNKVSEKAIEIANEEHYEETLNEIDGNWFLKWSEGAQDADEELVQEMWARLLNSSISGKSVPPRALIILSQLDSDAANLFKDFNSNAVHSNCEPFIHNRQILSEISEGDRQLLKEYGLIDQFVAEQWDFGWLTIKHNEPDAYNGWYVLGNTIRGWALANAVFDIEQLEAKQEHLAESEVYRKRIAKFIIEYIRSSKYLESFNINVSLLNGGHSELQTNISYEDPEKTLSELIETMGEIKDERVRGLLGDFIELINTPDL